MRTFFPAKVRAKTAYGTLRMLQCTTDNDPKMGEVKWVGKKLALHRRFQERGLQPDSQMPISTPIQAPDVTLSGKPNAGQVAQNHLSPLVINLISDRGIFHSIP